MATLADALRRAADVGRRAAGAVAQRDVAVTLVVEPYDAAVGAAGAVLLTTTRVVLDPRPKVTAVGAVASAFGGGLAVAGGGDGEAPLYQIGPITKVYPGGGYDRDDLFPPASSRKRTYYLLVGDEFAAGGEKFRAVSVARETPQSITLVVQRTQQ